MIRYRADIGIACLQICKFTIGSTFVRFGLLLFEYRLAIRRGGSNGDFEIHFISETVAESRSRRQERKTRQPFTFLLPHPPHPTPRPSLASIRGEEDLGDHHSYECGAGHGAYVTARGGEDPDFRRFRGEIIGAEWSALARIARSKARNEIADDEGCRRFEFGH